MLRDDVTSERGDADRLIRLPVVRDKYSWVDAYDLLREQHEPLRVVVDQLLSEGAYLFGGGPKAGKSYLALSLALSIAWGTPFMEQYEVASGSVLYIDLDNPRAPSQERLRHVLDGREVPHDRLYFAYEWPRFGVDEREDGLGEGGLCELDRWLTQHPDTALVVVDMLKNVRPLRKAAEAREVYASDSALMERINRFALDRHICILLLHHTNKKRKDEDDPMSGLSGSNGLLGGCSGALLLERRYNSDAGSLCVVSRYFSAMPKLSVKREELSGEWQNAAPAPSEQEVAERATHPERIRAALSAVSPRSLTLSDLQIATGIAKASLRMAVGRMYRGGAVTREACGAYRLPMQITQDRLPSITDDTNQAAETLAAPGSADRRPASIMPSPAPAAPAGPHDTNQAAETLAAPGPDHSLTSIIPPGPAAHDTRRAVTDNVQSHCSLCGQDSWDSTADESRRCPECDRPLPVGKG